MNWPMLKTYFMITVILSLLGWTGLARIVRSKLLELREQDFVRAARLAGASDMTIIVDHLLPNFMSYLIVSITLLCPRHDPGRNGAQLPWGWACAHRR